jgi:chemotaxis protein MotB
MSLAQALGGKTGVITHGGDVGETPVNKTPSVQDSEDGKGNVNLKINANNESETEKIHKKVKEFVKENGLEAKISIKEDVRGVIIELQEKILFDSGQAVIKSGSLPLLNKITDLLGQFPNEIIVEGHTDNVPINRGYYQTNWELSADRAVKVTRYLTEKQSLTPGRIQAVGCGEFRPIASNNSPEGRQKNRRVNILIVTIEKESSQK